MPSKVTSEASATTDVGPAQMLQFGKERTEAMIHVQQEFLDAYQQAGKAWVDRVQSEVKFWSELAGKLAASRSVPEGMETCSESIAHRMQMAAEDGRRLFEDGQKMIAAVTATLTNGSARIP
jgi:Phasin protein